MYLDTELQPFISATFICYSYSVLVLWLTKWHSEFDWTYSKSAKFLQYYCSMHIAHDVNNSYPLQLTDDLVGGVY